MISYTKETSNIKKQFDNWSRHGITKKLEDKRRINNLIQNLLSTIMLRSNKGNLIPFVRIVFLRNN